MTKTQYDRYVSKFVKFMTNNGIENLSTITADEHTGEWVESGFTRCDVCGDRDDCHECNGFNRESGEIRGPWDVCSNCVYFAECGKLDDTTMMEVEKDAARPDRVKLLASMNLLPTDNLPSHAWPGGYPIFYLCEDNGALCPTCANGRDTTDEDARDDPQWNVVSSEVHYEGPPIICDHCNAEVESAYGDPAEPELNEDKKLA